jgi:hypothetical protein
MANIFALQGPGHCGKSETIVKVLKLLEKKYNVPPAQIQYFHNDKVDKAAILSGVNGKKIGIESYGDGEERIRQSLTAFVKAGCDIIFCACRTRGLTVGCIKGFDPPHPVNITQQTFVAPAQQNQSNINMAYTLIQQAGL